MKKKIEPDYVASWQITAMSKWRKAYIDKEELARLVIKEDGGGTLRFGAVRAELDCRMEDVGVAEHLAFTFTGSDGMKETSGYDWAVSFGNRLEGEVFFHLGDHSTFNARKEKKRRRIELFGPECATESRKSG